MLGFARAAGTAEAAIRAAEGGRCQRADDSAGLLVAHRAFSHHERAFVFAFIEHAHDFSLSYDGAIDRQRLMDREALLTMHHVATCDARVALRVPRAGISQYDRHRRKGLE